MNQNIIFIMLAVFLASCKPTAYLTSPAEFKNHIHGLHIECKIKDGRKILGEIIEVKDQTMTVLQDDEYIEIPMSIIKKAEVIVASTSDSPNKFDLWTSLLCLSSFGHGIYGVVSLPINLSAGIGTAANAKKGSYRVKYPEDVTWDQMSKFARFPQGIPPNFYTEENQ